MINLTHKIWRSVATVSAVVVGAAGIVAAPGPGRVSGHDGPLLLPSTRGSSTRS